jgi:8-oxo-dGTP pyrophosphatase MutT (NUDIX family)
MGEDAVVTDANPLPLPAAMVRRAREFRGEPAPTRPAATVVLLRPEGETFQLYVVKRAATMVFGGVHAFPGGGVDPSDRPETIRTDWADVLGVPDDQARAVVGAAARELFEEAGVLLAGPLAQVDRTVGDVSTGDWEADRAAVAARELTMTELLRRRGLRLRDDLLFAWARWITPEFEPKRFDTWFFVALLPDGQTARDVSGESETAMWLHPGATGELTMLPPTRSTIDSIAAYEKMAEVVAAASRRDAATPVLPRVELTGDGGALLHIE